jgi:hypothetical protein
MPIPIAQDLAQAKANICLLSAKLLAAKATKEEIEQVTLDAKKYNILPLFLKELASITDTFTHL